MRTGITAIKGIKGKFFVLLLSVIMVAAVALPFSRARAESSAVTTDHLNLRTGPSTGYSIILTIPKGQAITIHSSSGNWYYVTTASGRQGYVCADYVQITSSGSSVAAVSTG